jgi:hypothetical protein
VGSRYGQTNQLLQEVKRLLEGCEAFPHPGFLPKFTAHIRKDSYGENSFSTEEIVALFWLRRWYQTGGSDRMELLRHWEFLKRLVKAGRLEM